MPRYTLLLSTDSALIDAAQRLRHDVFTCEPGFALDGRGRRSGCRPLRRILRSPAGPRGQFRRAHRLLSDAPAVGRHRGQGLYTATEFDVQGLDSLRPSLVEMGRAVVREDHRNGGVVLLMWAGILADPDRCGYDYVTGCVSVPVAGADTDAPGSQIRGIRDFVRRRHAAPAEYTVYPYRPVTVDGNPLDDIDPPARVAVPPLMRGYLRLGAQVCGDPAHDPDFGVGDFPALLGQTSGRHPVPRTPEGRSVRRALWPTDDVVTADSPWLPRATCDASCVTATEAQVGQRMVVAWRVAIRATFAFLMLSAVPLLAIPVPGRSHVQRSYCMLMLRCLGVRFMVSWRSDPQSAGRVGGQRPCVVGGHLRDRLGHARTVRRQVRDDQLAGARDSGAADEGHSDRSGQLAPSARCRRGDGRAAARRPDSRGIP